MTISQVSTWLLVAAVLSGSISIVAVLPFVLALAILHLGVGLFLGRRGLVTEGPVPWLILYMAISVGYAALIGVDLTQIGVYRRELKYLVPFSAFAVFSSLHYAPGADRAVRRALLVLGVANIVLFLVSPLLALSHVVDGLYADQGNIWQAYGPVFIYLGPFLSHSGAGGWFGTAALVSLGVSTVRELPPRIRFSFKGFFVFYLLLLAFTVSRAYLVAVAAVLAHIFLGGTLRKRMYVTLAFFGIVAAASTLVPFLGSRLSSNSLVTLSYARSTSEYNVLARYVLWGKAIEDFAESPLIGVGITRFDDDVRVIATFPTEVEEIYSLEGEPRYFRAPLIRVNVGSTQVHTDQQAHNMFFHILAEGGLLMFTLMIATVTSTLRWLARLTRITDGFRRGLARGVLWSMYAVLVSAFFGNGLFTVTPMFFLLSLGGYLNSVTVRASRTEPRTLGLSLAS